MALVHTPVVSAGWQAPSFDNLKGVDGKTYSLEGIKGENGTLVMFICNHCPYVKGIMDRLPQTMEKVQALGVGVIAVMSNDAVHYPEDSFDKMALFEKQNNFTFPYALDETQQVARAYGAVCTPDFFGFNKDLQLQYRGRLDSAGKNATTNDTVPELYDAMKLIAQTGHGPDEQIPSMGCSIKWKE